MSKILLLISSLLIVSCMGQYEDNVITVMCSAYDTACGYGNTDYDPVYADVTACGTAWQAAFGDFDQSECLFYSTAFSNTQPENYCEYASGDCTTTIDNIVQRANVFCNFYNGVGCTFGDDNWADLDTCVAQYQLYEIETQVCLWNAAAGAPLASDQEARCLNSVCLTDAPTSSPTASPTLPPVVTGFDSTIIEYMCDSIFDTNCGYASGTHDPTFADFAACNTTWWETYTNDEWDRLECLIYNSFYGQAAAATACPNAAGGGICDSGSVAIDTTIANNIFCNAYSNTCAFGGDNYDDSNTCISEFGGFVTGTHNCLWYSLIRAQDVGASTEQDIYCDDAGGSTGGASMCVTPSPTKAPTSDSSSSSSSDSDSDSGVSMISCLIGFVVTFINFIIR